MKEDFKGALWTSYIGMQNNPSENKFKTTTFNISNDSCNLTCFSQHVGRFAYQRKGQCFETVLLFEPDRKLTLLVTRLPRAVNQETN